MAIELDPVCSIAEMEEKLGCYFDVDSSWIVAGTGHYKRRDGTTIAHIYKGAIDPTLVNLATTCYMRVGKMVSSNRGHASGMQSRGRSHSTYEKGRDANSGIMGYIDNTNLRRPCRLTQFSKQHFEHWSRGLPFIRRIDECYKHIAPASYTRQREEAQRTGFHIQDTAFSTVTVNYNFRTSLHKDNGDFRGGCGNLVVCQEGIRGGWVMFPRYKLAITLDTGDFLAMDVHEYHCNSPIIIERDGGYRLSFVCYLRERMSECDRINTVISRMHAGTTTRKSADDWITEIFSAFGENPIPRKIVIGKGATGHEWWEKRGNRVTIRYKNKRYTLQNHETGDRIHELAPMWDYAMRLNNPHQSREDDG